MEQKEVLGEDIDAFQCNLVIQIIKNFHCQLLQHCFESHFNFLCELRWKVYFILFKGQVILFALFSLSLLIKWLEKRANKFCKLFPYFLVSVEAHLLYKSLITQVTFKCIKAMRQHDFNHDFVANYLADWIRLVPSHLLNVRDHCQVDKVYFQAWKQLVQHDNPLFNELLKCIVSFRQEKKILLTRSWSNES